MDLLEKLGILADSAKYDVSCASSGSSRTGGNGFGTTRSWGVCHTWSADGRCVSLLKLLFSNVCIYDCAYCINRRSNDILRTSFTVDELVDLTVNFYKRNYIEGLFLSSGVFGDPDYTMDKLIRVARRLRKDEGFRGYIHLKIIPGTTRRFVEEAGRYADRLSVNIELPSESSLRRLAPQKSKGSIVGVMNHLTEKMEENREEGTRYSRPSPSFAPAGQSTQLIVGASPETDRTIMNLSSYFYRRLKLRRVYYSAFVPVNTDGPLSHVAGAPMHREHRLYQADWLIRLYKFDVSELFEDDDESIDGNLDPKTQWALRHYHLFPVEVVGADYETLLRTPGIGFRSAERIVRYRRNTRLDFAMLKKFGVVLKRARYFITCHGVHLEPRELAVESLRDLLADSSCPPAAVGGKASSDPYGKASGEALSTKQLLLFGGEAEPYVKCGKSGRYSAGEDDAKEQPVHGAKGTRVAETSGAAADNSSGIREVFFRYDGTFTGLLSLLEKLRNNPELVPVKIERSSNSELSPRNEDFFRDTVCIINDRSAADRFIERFVKKESLQSLELVHSAFLSEKPDIEMAIVDFCRGSVSRNLIGREDSSDSKGASFVLLENAERRFFREIERFLGFLRFHRNKDGLFVAEMEPECNILSDLAPLMVERMSSQKWCIIDRKRNRAAFHSQGRLAFHAVSSGDVLRIDCSEAEEEDENIALWRHYIERIAVKERINTALQRHFLPQKYHRYLTEMNKSRTAR